MPTNNLTNLNRSKEGFVRPLLRGRDSEAFSTSARMGTDIKQKEKAEGGGVTRKELHMADRKRERETGLYRNR